MSNYIILGDDLNGNATVRMFINGDPTKPVDEVFQYVVPVSVSQQLEPIVNARLTELNANTPVTSVNTPYIETPEVLTPTVADQEVATDPNNSEANPVS